MSDVSSIGYTSGIKQSFVQKAALMASSEMKGTDISIFMDAMDKGAMSSTIDDLLKESDGQIPDNYDCKSFVEKLTSFVQGLFNKNTPEQQPVETSKQEKEEKAELNFTFETKTDVE